MRILIVEDDQNLCDLLAYQLETAGFAADCCYHGGEALLYVNQNIYDLVLLDRMLPETDGLTILNQIRFSGNAIPVILITAMGELPDKISGLDSGADDYLVKPFDFEELLARIRSISRRPRKLIPENNLSAGDITLKTDALILIGPAGECTLSKRECSLLTVFIHNFGQILPRTTLILKVWGPDTDIEEGNLDNYIHFLRRRLKSVHSNVAVATIRGVGYQLK
jgi:DNA-binding response OmpR family regulator